MKHLRGMILVLNIMRVNNMWRILLVLHMTNSLVILKKAERKIEAKGKFLDTITKKLKAGQDENIVLQTSIHDLTQSLVVYKLFG